MPKNLQFIYTNWKGITSIREVVPVELWFGSTEYHKEPQWLLKAYDVKKKAERDFATKDITFYEGR